MRSRWIYDQETQKVIPAAEWYAKHGTPVERGPMVIGDIEPYKSVVTGEHIGGRRQHRDHLRAHGLEEVGNERLPPRQPEPLPDPRLDVKESIERVQAGEKPQPLESGMPPEVE